ncbi:efflux RND transporter periplasmic adaptor subunit [Cohnella nanjingensis]|uniref:HlyD family efflux transporter periplasmic adaptor subunit n=1 Tax=Cohnella nanjingensis TaxID=1387779 RepID=A0A7X0RQV8_9BACL|nr:HlyD family efflux transporter periplasmic adaptor subunit [Cohnella nanjingensis]MBB6670831.1 HlyD family efflux transporter periplasmic adaptor subunit [Cohnella nanjingensis]
MALRRQRMAGLALVAFLLVLAGLTLFSQTLQTALLPKVATAKPENKKLAHRIEGSGLIAPRKQVELNSDSGWKVAKVHVRNEDQVKKGQVLVTFDGTEAQQQLLDAEDELKKRNLNRELLQEQFMAAQRTEDEEMIRKAKRDLELDRLDRDIAMRRIETLRKNLAQKRTLTAPVNGKVANLQAQEGMSVPQGQPVLTLVKTGEGFQFTFTLDKESADLMRKNEKVTVNVNGDKPRQIEGTVVEMKDASQGGGGGGSENKPGMDNGNPDGGAKAQKTIVVYVSGDGLQGGESASVNLEKPFKEQGLVISKKWLKKDGSGSYVFVVREKRSSLGNTYTVQKAYVKTGNGNDEEIVVLGGVYLDEEIVTESSEPLQAGNRVRLN